MLISQFISHEAEGVDVDASGRNVGVVLVRLDEIEVSAHALGETVMTVKLELSGEDGVEARVRPSPRPNMPKAPSSLTCLNHALGLLSVQQETAVACARPRVLRA